MVDVGERKGTIQETEKFFINNIFDFNDKSVSEIMTHRTNVVGLSMNLSLPEIIKITSEEKYTRYPIYRDSLDNIIGILLC